MNTPDLIELDLDRLRRLDLGKVSIVNQTDVQITYQIDLKDSHNPSAVITATGRVQLLFGPRLLSSGSHADTGGNSVTARVCLQYSRLTKNEPSMASVKSFLLRASAFPAVAAVPDSAFKDAMYYILDELVTIGKHAPTDISPVTYKTPTHAAFECRDLGDWESDDPYEEDDDQQTLSKKTAAALKAVIHTLESKYRVKITFMTGEKNWLYFTIKKV